MEYCQLSQGVKTSHASMKYIKSLQRSTQGEQKAKYSATAVVLQACALPRRYDERQAQTGARLRIARHPHACERGYTTTKNPASQKQSRISTTIQLARSHEIGRAFRLILIRSVILILRLNLFFILKLNSRSRRIIAETNEIRNRET